MVPMYGNRNRQAAEMIRRLRTDEGLTPEALAHTISMNGAGPVSGRTIRRIESQAVIPGVRIQFALAQHFGLQPTQMWPPKVRLSRAVRA
jgi:transcriptional regulator with XRE-family HTH domain